MQLRDYQRECIDATYSYFQAKDGNPLLVLPTGAGKSVIIGKFIEEVMTAWPNQRVMMITHVKELIQQNAIKLGTLWPAAPFGIYSAGLKQRNTMAPIIFGGIQSVHNKAKLIGHMDLLLIDECHLVPTKSATMYRRFIDDMMQINPHLKVLGFTATPYRLDSGYLHTGEDRIFTHIAYNLPITRLIDDGYLSSVVSKGGAHKIDLSGVRMRGGEYKPDDLAEAVEDDELTREAVAEMLSYGANRKSWLIFCASVKHAQMVADCLNESGVDTRCVHGGTPVAERDETLQMLKDQKVRAVTNMNVLTTGFDAPNIDFLVMLRPTQSASLYIQMVGRGMRVIYDETMPLDTEAQRLASIANGTKPNCLVLDFAGNVARHGPIDKINIADVIPTDETGDAPAKECPDCAEIVHAALHVCPACGYEWPPRGLGHDRTATEQELLSKDDGPSLPAPKSMT